MNLRPGQSANPSRQLPEFWSATSRGWRPVRAADEMGTARVIAISTGGQTDHLARTAAKEPSSRRPTSTPPSGRLPSAYMDKNGGEARGLLAVPCSVTRSRP